MNGKLFDNLTMNYKHILSKNKFVFLNKIWSFLMRFNFKINNFVNIFEFLLDIRSYIKINNK